MAPRPVLLVVFASGAALLPATAGATVLHEPVPKQLTTSGCLGSAIWHKTGSGGSRTVTVTVHKGGRRLAVKRLRATDRWRSFSILCGKLERLGAGVYTTRIRADGRTTAYRTRVRWARH